MNIARCCVAIILLLVTETAVGANMGPPVVYNTDPGFQQAYTAELVAVPIFVVSVLLAICWAGRIKFGSTTFVLLLFVLLVLWWYFYGHNSLNPNRMYIQYGEYGEVVTLHWLILNNTPQPDAKTGFGVMHKPELLRKSTQGEARLVGIFGSGAICFGGLALVRWVFRRTCGTVTADAPSNPTAKARFLREARAQAAVEHDNIIAIYQVGEERSVPFIAIPLLKGETLADALKANAAVPIGEAVRIAREMAAGLAAAHKQSLIHRDIKPANVWLESPHRRVKILDFGLARTESDAESTVAVTREGAVIGTPAYMSPEQAQGQLLDARTDLFSLGVVLYQMLTGRLPFCAGNTTGLLIAVATETPPRPATLNPQVPIELDVLTMRLLAKSVADRPASAEAVVEALRLIDSGMNRTAQIPVVMYAPTAGAVADPWQSIANTEPESEPADDANSHVVAATEVEATPSSRAAIDTGSRRSKSRPWLLIASLLAFVAVTVVAASIIFKSNNKDDSETENQER